MTDPKADLDINARAQLSILETCREFNSKIKKLNENFQLVKSKIVTSKELMNMIFEIAGIEREIKYSDRSNNEDHYSLTPYRDISRKAKKITPKEWIDIGEGILEVIKEIRSR